MSVATHRHVLDFAARCLVEYSQRSFLSRSSHSGQIGGEGTAVQHSVNRDGFPGLYGCPIKGMSFGHSQREASSIGQFLRVSRSNE